ncbi:hypothetical protein JTE90_014971 [Oedothorax gibbosus]|uniref:Uncharacterized protein n=1 Tax=Oedothorax gibbosus TaxID=931172 RepID=A0AAV6UZ33_9ARAC|nr:hypothetical protein JTE90_014971 [Oedothorax gibbosus]
MISAIKCADEVPLVIPFNNSRQSRKYSDHCVLIPPQPYFIGILGRKVSNSDEDMKNAFSGISIASSLFMMNWKKGSCIWMGHLAGRPHRSGLHPGRATPSTFSDKGV